MFEKDIKLYRIIIVTVIITGFVWLSRILGMSLYLPVSNFVSTYPAIHSNNKCFSIAQNLQTVINALYSLDVYIIIYHLKAQ